MDIRLLKVCEFSSGVANFVVLGDDCALATDGARLVCLSQNGKLDFSNPIVMSADDARRILECTPTLSVERSGDFVTVKPEPRDLHLSPCGDKGVTEKAVAKYINGYSDKQHLAECKVNAELLGSIARQIAEVDDRQFPQLRMRFFGPKEPLVIESDHIDGNIKVLAFLMPLRS